MTLFGTTGTCMLFANSAGSFLSPVSSRSGPSVRYYHTVHTIHWALLKVLLCENIDKTQHSVEFLLAL